VISDSILERLEFPLTVPPTEIEYWRSLPAQQQPEWGNRWLVDKVVADLATLPGLVEWDEVRMLRLLLAEVAAGNLQVVQAGDCAEDPAECSPDFLTRKVTLLAAVAGVMRMNVGRPVVRVGRFAGQFAKPRSRPTERCGDTELPVYRGHMVNGPEQDAEVRRADPLRMLACYRAASSAMAWLREQSSAAGPTADPWVWTSHEALVLDYELPLVRRDVEGRALLSSTHWPWIGDRTRQPDGAHVRLLTSVINPVACKVGPGATPGELLTLCDILDPDHEPGRLTIIARMGADRVAERLPPLVAAVRAAGHPVIWMCDPMHGNTISAPEGRKTRLVSTLVREVEQFQDAVSGEGGVPGGMHLETTPDPVLECALDEREIDRVGKRYTSLCDPRLNPRQALTVAEAWRRADAERELRQTIQTAAW
jgi:3-deoxy-7-phosphoheptulonate synthase